MPKSNQTRDLSSRLFPQENQWWVVGTNLIPISIFDFSQEPRPEPHETPTRPQLPSSPLCPFETKDVINNGSKVNASSLRKVLESAFRNNDESSQTWAFVKHKIIQKIIENELREGIIHDEDLGIVVAYERTIWRFAEQFRKVTLNDGTKYMCHFKWNVYILSKPSSDPTTSQENKKKTISQRHCNHDDGDDIMGSYEQRDASNATMTSSSASSSSHNDITQPLSHLRPSQAPISTVKSVKLSGEKKRILLNTLCDLSLLPKKNDNLQQRTNESPTKIPVKMNPSSIHIRKHVTVKRTLFSWISSHFRSM